MLIFTCELCETTIEDPEEKDFCFELSEVLQVSTGVKRVCRECMDTLLTIAADYDKMSKNEHAEAHQENFIIARLALNATQEASMDVSDPKGDPEKFPSRALANPKSRIFT